MMHLSDVITEDELLEGVLDLALHRGWLRAHFRPAKTDKGYRTPVSGDGKGFPDLVLVRRRVLIFAELKAARGRLSVDQVRWKDRLQEVAAATSYVAMPNEGGARPSVIPTSYAHERPHAAVLMVVWTPKEWASGEIERILR